jgi:hypothetical protein
MANGQILRASAASDTALFGPRPKHRKEAGLGLRLQSLTGHQGCHASIQAGTAPTPGGTGPTNPLPEEIPVCHAGPDRFKVRGVGGVLDTPAVPSD